MVVAKGCSRIGRSGLLVQLAGPEGPFQGPGCLPGHSGRDLDPAALARCCRLQVVSCVPAENIAMNEAYFFKMVLNNFTVLVLLSKVTGGARVTLNVKSGRNIFHPNYEGWDSFIK
jgi:hypothetical protein